MRKAASEKQVALVEKLRGERMETEKVQELIAYIDTLGGRMTSGQASQLIGALLESPKMHRPSIEVGSEVGTPRFGRGTVLAIDGDIVTVETSHGIKKMFAGMLK